ncbi:MAG TPA: CNNM domain-containing protein [Bacteroidales bacterium]|nr:CNNM domain-containing protein [Bacteroidales bacterium]
MELLLLYLFIALGFSFLCSMLEAVILSITPSYVNVLADKGTRSGKLLKRFKDNIDKPLSAILTLNTFAHTIGAAGVGAQAQIIWGNESLSITSAVLTILILILSEIIPKTLGAVYSKKLSAFTAYALLVLIYSPLYPFIMISQVITKWLKGDKADDSVSREEISSMARLGTLKGIFRKKESLMIENLMKFDFIKVKDIMTPRVVVTSMDADTPVNELSTMVSEIPFSRIPVYEDNRENITGYILKDDLMVKLLKKEHEKKLKAFKRPILIVAESLPISSLYEKLVSEKEIISLVIDEYGGMAGIVTMEDLIETILGLEIVDESDSSENMQKLARDNWSKRANRYRILKKDEKEPDIEK